MSTSVTVNPHYQIILISLYTNSQVKISTLEIGVKLQIVSLYSRVHASEQTILTNPK